MDVEVVTPDEFMGEVIGDINSRRGKVAQVNLRNETRAIKSQIPLANMFGYATDLRSRTQGRATFTMQFLKYEPVPSNIAEDIINKSRGTSIAV